MGNKKSQISSTLIDFYGNFGDIERAKSVFYEICDDVKCSVNIAVLMSAYIQNEQSEQALECFDAAMNHLKDANCLNMAIKACSNTLNVQKGKKIISEIERNHFNDIQLKTTLIHFYGIANDLKSAIAAFESIENGKKSVITFGAMMHCFLNNDMNKECIHLFFECPIEPDLICYALVLNACANGRFYHFGQQIHK